MQKSKPKTYKISKKLIICAIVSSLVFVLVSVAVFFTLFYRISDTYEFVYPDLAGSYEQDIKQDEKISVRKNYVSSETHPKGVVISQYPEGLSVKKIPRGQRPSLVLNISTGREEFVMPSLEGLTVNSAQSILRSMQCDVTLVRLYEECEEEIVISTLPAAQSSICAGDSITLYVRTPRREERVKVPDVMGMDISLAQSVLEDAGFNYRIEYGYDTNREPSEVILQQPVPYTYAQKGREIILTINSD